VFFRVQRFCRNEAGVTAIEYAVLAAIIAVVLVVAMDRLGFKLAATLAKAAGMALSGSP
jgi:pilus assembly protein Flp/PilA